MDAEVNEDLRFAKKKFKAWQYCYCQALLIFRGRRSCYCPAYLIDCLGLFL